MKTILTVCVLILISVTSLAQNGINYKAIIKDGGGIVVANQVVTLQFTIKETSITGATIYEENHSSTTDANGLAILNIGEGTPITGSYSTIDWGNDEHFLNVQVDTGAGLVDLGTTAFKTVPYALHALNAASKIDELSDGKSDNDGTNDGSSLFLGERAGLFDDGSDNKNVGIGYFALWGNTTGNSNTGVGNVALSRNTTGYWNTAIGSNALQANDVGNSNTTSGFQSLFNNRSGSFNVASGVQSLANITTGSSNVAIGFGAGNYLNGSSNTFLGYQAGSGSSSTSRSISGSVFIGSQAGYNEANSNRLYIDNSSTSEPLIYGQFDTNFLRITGNMEIKGQSPAGLVLDTPLLDNYITFNTSNGGYKGYAGVYNGNNDMDFGTGAGNGTGKVHLVTTASPKLTVVPNGSVGIGTEDPTSKLHVIGNARIASDLVVNQSVFTEDVFLNNGTRISDFFNGYYTQMYVTNHLSPATDNIYNLGDYNRRWNSLWATDGTINTSDRRDKTNIQDMSYGLDEVMRLRPVHFNWKNRQDQEKKLGLIAQELLQVIPEVVKTHHNITDETGKTIRKEIDRIGVYYSDLIPVLVKAIQEQNAIIADQNNEITKLTRRMETLETEHHK